MRQRYQPRSEIGWLNVPVLRKLVFGLPIKLAERLQKRGHNYLAARVLAVPGRYYSPTPRYLDVLARVQKRAGSADRAGKRQAEHLHAMIKEQTKARQFPDLLRTMAMLEKLDRIAPLVAGRALAEQIVSDAGRQRLRGAALEARNSFPDSPFILHLIAMCEAMSGDHRKANRYVTGLIDEIKDLDDPVQRRRYNVLQNTWRVVDQIARGDMEWSIEATELRSRIDRSKASGKRARVTYKEQALQARLREDYLAVCHQELAGAKTLSEKIGHLSAMLRPGIRHVPSYASSYAAAERELAALRPEIEALLNAKAPGNPIKDVDCLCKLIKLSRALESDPWSTIVGDRLEEWSHNDRLLPSLWPVPAVLAEAECDVEKANRIMARVQQWRPIHNRDLKGFFHWAQLTNKYEEARTFYDGLPTRMKRMHAVMYYVMILQRLGLFAEALEITYLVQANLLTHPSRVNAFTNYGLIKRVGELRFLARTAKTFQRVPQPKKPKGVMLFAARNIDHLRRYPLMSMIEMKRQGWAVVPMVEGLLPKELTGIPEIDAMNGALTPMRRPSRSSAGVFEPLEDFEFKAENGTLHWGDIDLSHSVWEDAAINRRRYNIDYGCPALKGYLGNLAEWTRYMAMIAHYARRFAESSGTPVGLMSLFSARLPDSVFRPYCDVLGKPDTFFALIAANGYQNYFTNFSTNISQRLVVRNMTRHPEARSASFPLPENFERYYEAKKDRAAELTQKFGGVTRVKRSTLGSQTRDPAAAAAATKIAEWTARGGKVACAFGKVVCDSSVPFDGGPAHSDMKDWLNHSIDCVEGSDTLLLIKPHPHEINDQIATFPTEHFSDLIERPLGPNVMILGHRWFDLHDVGEIIDMGLIYNGTTAVELGIMDVPCVLTGHFAPIDYPVGHYVPTDRDDYRALLRFEKQLCVAPDLVARSATWLEYMSDENFTQPYRYHVRPVTNKVLYPPWWEMDDVEKHFKSSDPAVLELTARAIGKGCEPGSLP